MKKIFCILSSYMFFICHASAQGHVTSGFPIAYVWQGPEHFAVESSQGKYLFYSYDGKFAESVQAGKTYPYDNEGRKGNDAKLRPYLEKYNIPELFKLHCATNGSYGNTVVLHEKEIYKFPFMDAFRERVIDYHAGLNRGVAYVEKDGDYFYYTFVPGSDKKPKKLKISQDAAVKFAGQESFSPDGKYMASVYGGALYDLENGKLLWEDKLYRDKKIIQEFSDYKTVRNTFSADGKQIAFSVDDRILVLDIATGNLVKEIPVIPVPDRLALLSGTAFPVYRTDYDIYVCPNMKDYLYAPEPNKFDKDDLHKYNLVMYLVTPDSQFTLISSEEEDGELLKFNAELDKRITLFAPSKPKPDSSADKNARIEEFHEKAAKLNAKLTVYNNDADDLMNTITHYGNKYCCLSRIESMKDRLRQLIRDYEGLLKEYDAIVTDEYRDTVNLAIKTLQGEIVLLNGL